MLYFNSNLVATLKTTLYALQRLAEVAEHGDKFLSEETTVHRNGGSGAEGTKRLGRYKVRTSNEVLAPGGAMTDSPSFSSTEKDNYPDERPISPEAVELSDYLAGGTGRPLPGSWLTYPGLKRQMGRRDFVEVGSVLADILRQTGGALPEPEAFFGTYGQYRQIHIARSSRRRNGRRRAG